jgi:hypothetical protein
MPGVPRETTAERTARLQRAGALMCGPQPPSDRDLDAVEKFLAWLKAHPRSER